MSTPAELKYAETHEWVKVDRTSQPPQAVVGITDFAVKQLNDLVYMELPRVGQELNAGKEFGEVESVKAVSPLYAPLSGKVVAVNSDLPQDLDRLVKDPYGDGWLIKLELTDESGLDKLLDADAYSKQCAAEG
jgi:glycine cleavage system H protein